MAEINLTQQEADKLIAMDKFLTNANTIALPLAGEKLTLGCLSFDKREEFVLDCFRGTIKLSKVTHQMRARKVVPLVRLDIDSAPHQNPDGTEIGGTHLHIYSASYADKYAFPVPDIFSNISDIAQTLIDFMRYCNIKNTPQLTGELF
jgi:hypothetical protein